METISEQDKIAEQARRAEQFKLLEQIILMALEHIITTTQQIREMKAEEEAAGYRRDFLGVKFRPNMYALYPACVSCGRYVWHTNRTQGMCPHCTMTLPEFVLEISFGRSTSRKYRTALKCARSIPTYTKEGERNVVRFGSLGEYCDNRHAVDELTVIICNWKSTAVILNGEPATVAGIHSLSWEIDRIRDLLDAKSITFADGIPVFTPKEDIVPDNIITEKGEIIAPDGEIIGYTHPGNVLKIGAASVSEGDSHGF